MVLVTCKTDSAKAFFVRLQNNLTIEGMDAVVEKVAFQTLADVVTVSPKRWFGQLKSGWHAIKNGSSGWKVEIPNSKTTGTGTSVNDILRFVEMGTKNDGAGFIYPIRKKRLYIPLTKQAALGWNPGLKYGTDYILRPRVRGIKARHFVRDAAFRAQRRLFEAAKVFVEKVIKA